MVTKDLDQTKKGYDIPELCMSLWSIRYRMNQRPSETLALLQSWGIKTVEVAGFFNYEAKRMKEDLSGHNLNIGSLVGPPFKAGRDMDFYRSWLEKYIPIFDTKTIVLQSLYEIFQNSNSNNFDKICDTWVSLYFKIAEELQHQDIKLSYHCFPHDFKVINNHSFISRIFESKDSPGNVGLQLDTFWLKAGDIEPLNYTQWPVHSFHINERNERGDNCLLSYDGAKFIKYIKPYIHAGNQINWILENDSSDIIAKENDGKMLDTLKKCIFEWPTFFDSLGSNASQPLKEEIKSQNKSEPISLGNSDSEDLLYENYTDNDIYKSELDDVLTEYLFGKEQMFTLSPDNPKLMCYVDKRKSYSGVYDLENFYAERIFLSYNWPSEILGEQIIQVIGGAGSGKSTFIRFFYQYYLPYFETIVNNSSINSDEHLIHTKAFQRHILLYVNLRRGLSTKEMIPYIYEKLGEALISVAEYKNINLGSVNEAKFSKRWLKKQILYLAKEVEANERKWYISWVLDNSDQMDEDAQRDLIKLMLDWIPEEPSTISSKSPVIEGDHRELWRIVIPIRPETLIGLTSHWTPCRNRRQFDLSSIDQDLLISKRADYLGLKVLESTKNPFIDVNGFFPLTINKTFSRPQFNMIVPSEKAPEMKQILQLAHSGESQISDKPGIPEDAKPIIDLLVHDSARRRLFLVRRIAFNRTFRIRRQQGQLSKFYFFEALIRGNDELFNPSERDDIVLLNLYNMGNGPKNEPFSICVGLHAIFLLKQDMEWEEVKKSLKRIGYQKDHLKNCESWLEAKEIIKRNGNHRNIDTSIIAGHWALLKERAYTDNMAVSCAIAWEMQDKATPTDPLDPTTLLPRISSSIWFMRKIWQAELALAYYSSETDFQHRCGDFNEFSLNRKHLCLPSIANLIAQEYLSKTLGLLDHPKTKIVIERDKDKWNLYIRDLESLVKLTGKENALEAYLRKD
jgi:hypothetical protein